MALRYITLLGIRKMKKRIAITYLIGIHILLVIVLLKSNFIDSVQSKLGIQQAASPPEITQHFRRMLRYHRRIDGNVPDGAFIFIGDSITQGLCVSAIASPSVNYGIGSDTTVGVLQRLPDYKSIERASAVLFAIGINDMKRRANEEIVENYRAIIDQIPSTIPIIFSAVLPLDKEARDEWQGRNQTRIRELNARIKGLTEESDNLFFIDAGSQLIDENGNLSDKFHDGDGVHLNSRGNAIWIGKIREAIETAQRNR